MFGTQDASHIWQLDYVNLICGESGGFRRGKHSAALFHNPNQDVSMAVHGDDFVCLSDDDGLKHIDSRLKSKYTARDMGSLGFEDYVNLICGESGGFRRRKHSAALFHNPNQDVSMAVHGDDFVCLSDDDGLKHIDSLLKSKYTARDMGSLGFEDSDVKSHLLLNREFRVGVDQTGQYLDIELDLRQAPLITSESGCNTKH